MSKILKNILVAGASLLMLSSIGTGMSSVHTNAHAASQAVLEKIGESKDPDKAIAQWLARHRDGVTSPKPMKMTPEERRENDARMAKNDAEANNDQIKWIEAGGHTKAQAERLLHKQERGNYNIKSHKTRKDTKAKHSYHKSSTKRNHNHKARKTTKIHRYQGHKQIRYNKHNLRKSHKTAKARFKRQYKQGFNASKTFSTYTSTERSEKSEEQKYYNALHYPMTKAYKDGFLKGAEQAGRKASLTGMGYHAYQPKIRRRAFKKAHKSVVNSLAAWKYSLTNDHNHSFNLGEKAELGLTGDGYSLPKSLKHFKHNRSFKAGWITAYDYTAGISIKNHRMNNGNYSEYING